MSGDYGSADTEPLLPMPVMTTSVAPSDPIVVIAVGVMAAAMFLILLFAGVIVLWERRRHKRTITQPTFENPTGYAIYNYDPDPSKNLIMA